MSGIFKLILILAFVPIAVIPLACNNKDRPVSPLGFSLLTPSMTSTTLSSRTATSTPTFTSTSTPSLTAINTATNSPTRTSTATATSSGSPSPTSSTTSSPTSTPISTATGTPSSTSTDTATSTVTGTPSSTAIDTATNTTTETVTNTASEMPTGTANNTVTQTPTPLYSAAATIGAGSTNLVIPDGIGYDNITGNLWLVDSNNNNLQEWLTVGGTANASLTITSFSSPATAFNGPTGVGINPKTGDVYVADQANSQFEVFSSNGTYLTTFGQTQFLGSTAQAVAVNSAGTTVYTLDRSAALVRLYSITGSGSGLTLTYLSGLDFGHSVLKYPYDLCLDGSGNIYLVDPTAVDMFEFSSAGSLTETLNAGLQVPVGVAVDGSGNVFVVDNDSNGYIIEYNSSGTELGKFGNLNYPQSITLDTTGNLYASEISPSQIVVFQKN